MEESTLGKLFKHKAILTKSGPMSFEEAFKDAKCIGIYFSAHWCPPCRGFTPVLAAAYKEANTTEKVCEVLFVSSDQSEEEYKSYFESMPWTALPFDDHELKKELSSKYGVKGIPMLVVVKPDGTLINANARGEITSKGPHAFEEFANA